MPRKSTKKSAQSNNQDPNEELNSSKASSFCDNGADTDDPIPVSQDFENTLTDDEKRIAIQQLMLAGAGSPILHTNGFNARYLYVPIGLLKIPPYQRSACVPKSFVNDFNPALAGAIHVSLRDGLFWIVNGQHRVRAANERNIPCILCIVMECLTLQKEAETFLELNRKTTPITLRDRFKAEYIAGYDDAVNINRILAAYNMHVLTADGEPNNRFTGLDSAYKIFHSQHGDPADFEWIMKTMNIADWGDTKTHTCKMLWSMHMVYNMATSMNPQFTLDEATIRLQTQMAAHSYETWNKAADARYSKEYNDHRKRMTRLTMAIASGEITDVVDDDVDPIFDGDTTLVA